MATHRYSDGYRSFREADPARQVAFEVLTLVRNEDAYANLVLPKVLKSFEGQAHLDQRDRAFAVGKRTGRVSRDHPIKESLFA